MRRKVVVTILLVAAFATTFYLTGGRTPFQVQEDRLASNDTAVVEVSSYLDNAASGAENSPARVEAAAAELRSMSPTFRNSTFLIAIRGSGFYCDGVVSAHESTAGVWLASCMEKLGYTLNVRDVDGFDVRPVAHYFDSVSPSPQLRERLDRDSPPEALQLERLR